MEANKPDWVKAPLGAEYWYKLCWYKTVNEKLFVHKKKGKPCKSNTYHWTWAGYVAQFTEKMIPRPDLIVTGGKVINSNPVGNTMEAKKMEAKKVIDAVNNFESEWRYTDSSSTYYRNNVSNGYWYYGETKPLNDEHVCTHQEFKQLVFELETNFGRSVTYYKYKLESKIIANFNKKPKPVFTQEMADKGTLPCVGMECKIKEDTYENPYECEIIFTDEDVIFIKYGQNGLFFYRYFGNEEGVEFKPITPPIELIDGKAYQFDIVGAVYLGFYVSERKSFFDTYLPPNKICGVTEAGNIKLLEVKS